MTSKYILHYSGFLTPMHSLFHPISTSPLSLHLSKEGDYGSVMLLLLCPFFTSSSNTASVPFPCPTSIALDYFYYFVSPPVHLSHITYIHSSVHYLQQLQQLNDNGYVYTYLYIHTSTQSSFVRRAEIYYLILLVQCSQFPNSEKKKKKGKKKHQ